MKMNDGALKLALFSRFRSDLSVVGYLVAFKFAFIGLFLMLRGGFVQMVTAWDAEIYLRIAQTGYYNSHDPNLYVFAPLYPTLIHFLGGFWAAFLIANLFSIASIFLLYKMTNLPTALLLASFPTFLVFGTSAYADPLMLFFLILSYWLYRKENYPLMCCSLTLAALSKYTALIAVPVFLILVAYRTRLKLRTVLVFGIPVCAMGGIMYWLWKATSDPLAFIHLQAAWGAAGLVNPLTQADWVLHGWFTNSPAVLSNSQPWMWLVRNYAFQIPALILLGVAVWKHKLELVAIGLPFVVLTLTTIGMPAISTPRLILPGIWVIFVAFKDEIGAHKIDTAMISLGFLAIGLLWLLEHSVGAFIA